MRAHEKCNCFFFYSVFFLFIIFLFRVQCLFQRIHTNVSHPSFVADCSKLQILRKYERYETTYDYKYELNARAPIQTHPISLIERTEGWTCIDDARFSFHSPEKTDFVPMFPLCHWMCYIFVLFCFFLKKISFYFTFVFFIADAEHSYIWNNLYRPRLCVFVCVWVCGLNLTE